MKISKRLATAIKVISEGGAFRPDLEPNCRGHMKFVTRLYTSEGRIVPGVGRATEREWKAVEAVMDAKAAELIAARTK